MSEIAIPRSDTHEMSNIRQRRNVNRESSRMHIIRENKMAIIWAPANKNAIPNARNASPTKIPSVRLSLYDNLSIIFSK